MLDPETAEPALRDCAAERGIDFDELTDAAARHFAAPVIVPPPAPTLEELAEIEL